MAKGKILHQSAEGDFGVHYLELIMHYALTGIEKHDKVRIEELLKSCLTQESEVHTLWVV